MSNIMILKVKNLQRLTFSFSHIWVGVCKFAPPPPLNRVKEKISTLMAYEDRGDETEYHCPLCDDTQRLIRCNIYLNKTVEKHNKFIRDTTSLLETMDCIWIAWKWVIVRMFAHLLSTAESLPVRYCTTQLFIMTKIMIQKEKRRERW